MVKVKYYEYYSDAEPTETIEEFYTIDSAIEWIAFTMNEWYGELCDEFPDGVYWYNRLLDCGNETEIEVENTLIKISCTLIDD